MTFVLPCLNEAKAVSFCLTEVWSAASIAAFETEVILADNGSMDQSAELAASLGARVVQEWKTYDAALLGAYINPSRRLVNPIAIGHIQDARAELLSENFDGAFDAISPAFAKQSADTFDENLGLGCALVQGWMFVKSMSNKQH